MRTQAEDRLKDIRHLTNCVASCVLLGAEAVANGLLAVATAAVEIAERGRRPEAVRLPLHGALLNVAMAGEGAHATLSPAAVAAVMDGA